MSKNKEFYRLEDKIDNLVESTKNDRVKLYDHVSQLYEQAKTKEVKIEVINQTLVAIQKGMADQKTELLKISEAQKDALVKHMEAEEKSFSNMTHAIEKMSDSIMDNRNHYDAILKDVAHDFDDKLTQCRKSIISHIDKEFVTKEHALRIKEDALNIGRQERAKEMQACSKGLVANIDAKINNIESTITGAKWVLGGLVSLVTLAVLIANNFKFVGS